MLGAKFTPDYLLNSAGLILNVWWKKIESSADSQNSNLTVRLDTVFLDI